MNNRNYVIYNRKFIYFGKISGGMTSIIEHKNNIKQELGEVL